VLLEKIELLQILSLLQIDLTKRKLLFSAILKLQNVVYLINNRSNIKQLRYCRKLENIKTIENFQKI